MGNAGRIVLISVGGALLLAVGLYFGFMYFVDYAFGGDAYNSRANRDPEIQEEMVKGTLEWGRFAPIPESKREFQISTEGSDFTRSFRASFYLPKEDLASWIEASPGLHDADIETLYDSTKKYIVEPGGGAAYAEAIIDFDTGHVETYVCWS